MSALDSIVGAHLVNGALKQRPGGVGKAGKRVRRMGSWTSAPDAMFGSSKFGGNSGVRPGTIRLNGADVGATIEAQCGKTKYRLGLVPPRRTSLVGPLVTGALLGFAYPALIHLGPDSRAFERTMTMNATITKEEDCQSCFGTGNANSSMHSPYPPRKIFHKDCPVCKGTGKKPKAS
jgi:hypothetical protein